MERELVLELSEIERIWIVCPKCKAELQLVLGGDDASLSLPECGVCREEWREPFRKALRAFYVALRDLRTYPVRVRVIDPERNLGPSEGGAKKRS